MDLISFIFIVYLLFLLFVGFSTFKLNKTQEDYLLAGRKLGPWVTAFSERASGESAWLILGLPGAAIAVGYGEIWAVIGITLGIISSWFLIAEKLRYETEKYEALTVPEYLHKKFNDSSGIIKLTSAIIIGIFFTFYVSAQFHGSGKILNTIFGIDPLQGITLGAFVIILYTIMGGLLAVAWTDLLQGILMIGTLVILPIVGLIELSSLEQPLSELLVSKDPAKSSLFAGMTGLAALSVATGGLSWGLGYFGQPHLLIRYMAISSVKEVKKARWIASLWAIPGISGAFLIGIVGMAYFGEDFFIGKDSEIIMPLLAQTLLPGWLAGLLISGAVAAMMSTADSQLLVSTSAISEDLGINAIKKRKESDTLLNTRIITVLLGIFAYIVAMYSEYSGNTIFSIVSFAWSGLGSSFGPAVLLALWWNKTTREGVISGLFTGAITTLIWGSSPYLKSIVTERLSSFVFAFLAIVIVSKYKKITKTNTGSSKNSILQSGSYGVVVEETEK